jgi:hypothetical protein
MKYLNRELEGGCGDRDEDEFTVKRGTRIFIVPG